MKRGRVAALVAIAVLVPLALLGVVLLVNRDESSSADGGARGTMPMPAGAMVAGKADVGSTAPDFALPSLDGHDVSLAQLRGTPVVLTFYASWCYDCSVELPRLQQVHEDRGEDVAIVGVSYRDLIGDARDFVDELGLTFPMLHDANNDVAAAYGVRAIPQTFFIDADGVIRAREFGALSKGALAARVDGITAPA